MEERDSGRKISVQCFSWSIFGNYFSAFHTLSLFLFGVQIMAGVYSIELENEAVHCVE